MLHLNGVFPLSEMQYLSLFIRFATFTNSSTSFTLFLCFLLPFFRLSFTNCTTSRRSFSSIPGLVSILGKPAYASDIRSHQHGTFFLGTFANLRKANISFVMSVRPSSCSCVRLHGTTRLSLDGFSINLIFQFFFKVCPENQSFINIS